MSSLSFHNIGITSLGSYALFDSGVVCVDLGGLQLVSLGNTAFTRCSGLTSVKATSPCSLGTVGRAFLAFAPQLATFRYGLTVEYCDSP